VASILGHAVAAAALWPPFGNHRVLAVAVSLAVLPDIDVVGFSLGIPYGAMFGHRGLTHSLAAAVVAGGLGAWLLTRDGSPRRRRAAIAAYLIVAAASHGVLDAMTTGGLGVAFFAPFDATRYFFRWRPILVSPIGITRFFSPRGVAVLVNEAVWIGLPSSAIAVCALAVARLRKRAVRPRPEPR
jgi:inner membrane protein